MSSLILYVYNLNCFVSHCTKLAKYNSRVSNVRIVRLRVCSCVANVSPYTVYMPLEWFGSIAFGRQVGYRFHRTAVLLIWFEKWLP
jgi:hypothetical protein